MEIIEELEKLDVQLIELKKNFNNQLNAIEDDLKEFHKQVITLSSKYPDHKELLEFIVFINDRIEMKQSNLKEVISEALNEILKIKQELIKQNIRARKPKGKLESIDLNSIKWILIIVFGIGLLIVMVVSPDAAFKTIEFISKFKLFSLEG